MQNNFHQLPRRLRTFGIFSPSHWPIWPLERGVDEEIYSALKQAGFRETIWQYVFRGQRAGLILPLQNGELEVHVRFYADGVIDAELEIGRKYPRHFTMPRYPAGTQVLEMIKPHLSEAALLRADSFILKHSSENNKSFSKKSGFSYSLLIVFVLILVSLLVILKYLPLWVLFITLSLALFFSRTLPD